MSTRCQIRIQEEMPIPGEDKRDRIFTLYRHYDGYPINVVKDLQKAYRKYGDDLNGDRVDQVASFVCAINPTNFRPLQHNKLWMVSYFYNLYVVSGKASKPIWELEIFDGPHRIPSEKNPLKFKDFKLIYPRRKLEDIDLEPLICGAA